MVNKILVGLCCNLEPHIADFGAHTIISRHDPSLVVLLITILHRLVRIRSRGISGFHKDVYIWVSGAHRDI